MNLYPTFPNVFGQIMLEDLFFYIWLFLLSFHIQGGEIHDVWKLKCSVQKLLTDRRKDGGHVTDKDLDHIANAHERMGRWQFRWWCCYPGNPRDPLQLGLEATKLGLGVPPTSSLLTWTPFSPLLIWTVLYFSSQYSIWWGLGGSTCQDPNMGLRVPPSLKPLFSRLSE